MAKQAFRDTCYACGASNFLCDLCDSCEYCCACEEDEGDL